MRIKKIIASVLFLSICVGMLPATAAYAALSTDAQIISEEQVAGSVKVGASVMNADTEATVKAKGTHEKGDVNNDGFVDSYDASAILAAYAKIASSQESGLTYEQAQSGDVNGDGNVDSIDASSILAYYAYLSTRSALSIEEFLKKDNNPSTTATPVTFTTISSTSTTLEPTPLTTTSSTISE